MTEKELKKMSRRQLLELLLRQTERADALELELQETKERLAKRKIAELESGSIAEAALKLNGIFEAAESAVAQYMENIKLLSESGEEIEARARAKADEMIAEAEKICLEREKQTEARLEEIKNELRRIYKHKNALSAFSEDNNEE